MQKRFSMKETKKIKIGFLLGRVAGKGGISRVTSILTENLVQQEYAESVHIISFHKKDDVTYGWSDELEYKDLLNSRPSMLKGFYPALRRLIKYIKTTKLDILIATGHNVGPLAVLASWFTGVKIIYWSHSSFKASTNSRFRVLNEKFIAYFGEGIITLTKQDEQNYLAETNARRVIQIYNPVDSTLLSNKSKYNVHSKKIISVGRLTNQKNFLTLVDIAKIILDEHKDWEWHIYGSGEEETILKKKIFENNLNNRLILKGHENNIYSKYCEYSIMCMTSFYEGFPMTLIEGMANHIPLISFDIPTGPNEIIQDGTNGFLISPFDINEMAKKIKFIIENEPLRLSMSNANAQFINNFSMMKIQKQWKDLFKEVLGI